jgi:NAD(P)-dependent dehydrogenase (short-subunit alcohol dehydrogenase family)
MGAFAGQVVVVTGASEGIGRALCVALAPQRPRLVLAARNRERLDSLAAECTALGAECLVVPTDVTNPDDCRALIDAAVARFGGVDTLVNNAGGTMWTRLDEITDPSIFERLMRLNYLGSVYPTFHALPHLKRSRGRIVAVASVAGLIGVPTRTGYSAAKHAVIGFFDSLRVELLDAGVSVTVVCPDFVVSEIHKRALGADGRPLGDNPMAAADIMTAAACAAIMVGAIERRERLVLTSARSRMGRWMKLLWPARVDRMAADAIRRKR